MSSSISDSSSVEELRGGLKISRADPTNGGAKEWELVNVDVATTTATQSFLPRSNETSRRPWFQHKSASNKKMSRRSSLETTNCPSRQRQPVVTRGAKMGRRGSLHNTHSSSSMRHLSENGHYETSRPKIQHQAASTRKMSRRRSLETTICPSHKHQTVSTRKMSRRSSLETTTCQRHQHQVVASARKMSRRSSLDNTHSSSSMRHLSESGHGRSLRKRSNSWEDLMTEFDDIMGSSPNENKPEPSKRKALTSASGVIIEGDPQIEGETAAPNAEDEMRWFM